MTGRFEKKDGAQAEADRTPADGRRRSQEARQPQRRSSVLGLSLVVLLLLVSGQTVAAQQKGPQGQSAVRTAEANDPNELWWSKWDIPVEDPNDPNEVLAAKWNAVLKVLQAKDLDQTTKEKILDKLVSPAFDFPLMGQLALGRTHWPKFNPAQREKFVELFVTRLKALYLEKTASYKNEKATLQPAVQKKNTAQVPMVVVSDGKEIAILYKLHRLGEPGKSQASVPWKIYDVEIAGVSILLTYRSQFDDILRRGTVQDLLSHLEKSPRQ